MRAASMLASVAIASQLLPRVAGADGPRFRTERGTLVLLEEDHSFPIVSLSVTARSGSALDPRDSEGLARLTALALRRGVRGRTSDQIDALIDSMGAVLSVHVDHHSITLGGQVIRRNLEPFAELLSEMLRRPTFAPDEIARLKRETVAEIVNDRDSDRDLAMRHFRRFLFGRHAYGRSALGTTQSVEHIGRRSVRQMYRDVFVAKNLIIGAAGDLSEEELRELVDDHFSELRDSNRPVVRLPSASTLPGRRLLIVDKPERTQTQILIGQVGLQAGDSDYFPLTVANTVFGGTFTARLMKEVRSKRGWSYGAYSRLGRGRAPEAHYLWTFPAARDAVDCIKLELEMLSRFVREGVTASELAFAKSYLENNFAFEIDTADKRLDKRIDAEVLGLGRDYYASWVRRIREVDLAAANAAVRRHLGASDLSIVLVATASELRERLSAEIEELGRVEVVPFDRD